MAYRMAWALPCLLLVVAAADPGLCGGQGGEEESVCNANGKALLQGKAKKRPMEVDEEQAAPGKSPRYPLSLSMAESFWKRSPAEPQGRHAAFHAWRDAAVQPLRSRSLARKDRGFFAEHLALGLVMADRLGNNDGCISDDEHPDYSMFLSALNRAQGERVCMDDLELLVRSREFDESVKGVTAAHADGLLRGEIAREKLCFKVTESIMDLDKQLEEAKALQQDLVVKRSAGLKDDGLNASETEVSAAITAMRKKLNDLYAQELRCKSCEETSSGDLAPGDTELCLEEYLEDAGLLLPKAEKAAAAAGGGAPVTLAELSADKKQTTCVYGRADTCLLAFRDVPLLGTHNSGARPKLAVDCAKQVQQCNSWVTSHKNKCTAHKPHCAKLSKNVASKCTEWGTQCTDWSQKSCGWFSAFCGWFCGASKTVCEKSEDVITFTCDKMEQICTSAIDFLAYHGCNNLTWVCREGVRSIGASDCIFENQGTGLLDQLRKGVRALDVDTCFVGGELRNCHSGALSAIGKLAKGVDGMPGMVGNVADELEKVRALGPSVRPDLSSLKAWLDDNPGEVLFLRWSDMDDATAEHRAARMALINEVFGAEVADVTSAETTSDTVGWTKSVAQTLGDMAKTNVRLVVHEDTDGDKLSDSYSEKVTTGTAGAMMEHARGFCQGRRAGDTVLLSLYSRFASQVGWMEDSDIKVPCPNGDTKKTEACTLGGLMAKAKKLWSLFNGMSLAETSEGASKDEWMNGLCNKKSAAVVNKKAVEKLPGIFEACRSQDVSVSAVLVDFVSLENQGLQDVIGSAIDAMVKKRGIQCVQEETIKRPSSDGYSFAWLDQKVCAAYSA